MANKVIIFTCAAALACIVIGPILGLTAKINLCDITISEIKNKIIEMTWLQWIEFVMILAAISLILIALIFSLLL